MPHPSLIHLAPPHTILGYLSRLWAYVALGLSSIITEEAAPIIGGLAAHDGHLGFYRAFMACAAGSWGADVGLYFVGRWRGKWARRRWPKAGRFIARVLVVVRRRPWRASLAVRYVYGMRFTLPIACGAAQIRLWIYLVASALSAASWAMLFTLAGWGFGRTATIIIGHVRRYEDLLALIVLVGSVVGFVVFHWHHSRARAIAAGRALGVPEAVVEAAVEAAEEPSRAGAGAGADDDGEDEPAPVDPRKARHGS